MNNSIITALDAISLGDPVAVGTLTYFPLRGAANSPLEYLTLDQALTARSFRVGEASESGRVSELLAENLGDLPVFLLDGEELVGAKQNRIMNLSVLIAPHSVTKIPVSCVEAGRWSFTSMNFDSSSRAMFSRGRASKSAHVNRSLACEGIARTDQHSVWSDINVKSERMRAYSSSSAMAAIFDTHGERVEAYVSKFGPVTDQLGVLFVDKGQVVGMDLFDRSSACTALLPKLVRSVAIDSIESTGSIDAIDAATSAALQFLAQVKQADTGEYPAVGLGADVRIAGTGVVGGALVCSDRVVHLAAFRHEQDSMRGGRNGNLATASQRRRYAGFHR